MNIGNIDRLLLFRVENDQELTQGQLQTEYGFEPDGSNLYYGLNQGNLDNFNSGGQALNAGHQQFFSDMLSTLAASRQDEKTVVLGLEPLAPNTFDFVAANMSLVNALAQELAAQQVAARNQNKRLQIVVRYASEMNDPPPPAGANPWGRQPDHFKASFQQVREAFRAVAPDILFAFSPALRSDVNEAVLTSYWPGDEFVDVIGGTWYVHGMDQFAAAKATMRAYFLHRLGAGKPFGIDELSGRENLGNEQGEGKNDLFISAMLHDLEAFQIQNVEFKYVTLFLQFPWGQDATLQFLAGGSP